MAIGVSRQFANRCSFGLVALLFATITDAQEPQPAPPDCAQTQESTALTLNQTAPRAAADTPDCPPPAGTFRGRFRLHAYADVDFAHNSDAGTPNHFSVGEIVLFSSAAIAPKLSALAEVVLDTDVASSVSTVPINVERLLLQYRVGKYLTVEAGQYRTAIGYYSTAYLRGAWFQTAISRPRMFAFEEDGGILPLHTVGVSASGPIPSGVLGLHYVIETGNTRTWGSSAPADVTGHNAINFSVFARPQAIPGLEAGISDYHDRFSPFSGFTVNRGGVSAHVVYTANRFEFLNEGVVAHLYYGPASATATLSGFYSQLGYRVGANWGPYVRVEKLSIQADPFFFSLPAFAGVANWRSMYTGGVRYDWNDFIAIKVEAGHEADWDAPHYYRAAVQIAFGF